MSTLGDILAEARTRHAEILRMTSEWSTPTLVAPPSPHRPATLPFVPMQPTLVMPPPRPSDALVVTNDPSVASNILQRLAQHSAVGPLQAGSYLARAVPLLRPVVYWSNLKDAKAESDGTCHSLLSCKTLVECGLGLSDLYRLGLARDYNTLKEVLDFTPQALTVDYARLNINVLRQLYKIDYEDFIVDFGVGPTHYLLRLLLPLSDLHAVGIPTVRALMDGHWPNAVAQAHSRRGRPPPDMRRSQDRHTLDLLRPLDGKMFMARHEAMLQHKKIDESPSDWNRFLGMTVQDLADLGLKHQDISRLWVPRYGTTVENVLRRHFGAEEGALRDASPRRVHRRQRRHHRHHNQEGTSEEEEEEGERRFNETADTASYSPLDRF